MVQGIVPSCSFVAHIPALAQHIMARKLGLTGDVISAIMSLQGSVTQGKGRKLSGFDAVRFRNEIMRQTGFIEADTRDR